MDIAHFSDGLHLLACPLGLWVSDWCDLPPLLSLRVDRAPALVSGQTRTQSTSAENVDSVNMVLSVPSELAYSSPRRCVIIEIECDGVVWKKLKEAEEEEDAASVGESPTEVASILLYIVRAYFLRLVTCSQL